MNVVLFFTYEISLKNWLDSGLLDREIKLYQELSSKHKFTFITYGEDEDKTIIEDYPFIEVLPIYSVLKKSRNKIVRFFKSFYIAFYVKKNIKEFDLIKTNQLHGSWIPILLKLISKKPLYIRTGYNHFSFAREENKNLYTKTFFYYLTKLSLTFSDCYSTTSKVDRDSLLDNFKVKDSEKIKIIPNWVESSAKSSERYLDRILTVGRLENQKNYIELIKELRKSKFTLDIAGEGSLKKEMIECAEKYNVKINFLGLLSNKELMDLYSRYKIFLSSSLYEGNPKALLEAMSMGCVIISNKTRNIEEIIEDNKNGKFFSFKNNDLQKTIHEVMKDDDLFKTLSNNALNSVSKKNSFENFLNKELNIYKFLINS